MPLFSVNYPALAETFCNMLLQVAAFEAINTEKINERVWGTKLAEFDENADIGRFANLGYNGPSIMPNLASTLIMFSLTLLVPLAPICLSSCMLCCDCLSIDKSYFLGQLMWNLPIAFLINTYSVLAICSLLNI